VPSDIEGHPVGRRHGKATDIGNLVVPDALVADDQARMRTRTLQDQFHGFVGAYPARAVQRARNHTGDDRPAFGPQEGTFGTVSQRGLRRLVDVDIPKQRPVPAGQVVPGNLAAVQCLAADEDSIHDAMVIVRTDKSRPDRRYAAKVREARCVASISAGG